MWSLSFVILVEQQFGLWYGTLALSHEDGRSKNVFINFGANEPSEADLQIAGTNEAKRLTLAEAPVADLDDSISREELFARFTITEVAAIYTAAQANSTVLAYIKRLETSPRVHRNNPDLLTGLPLLEAAQLIAPGRAAAIMNW